MQYELLNLIVKLSSQNFDHTGISQFGRVGFVKADLSNMTCFQWYMANSFLDKMDIDKGVNVFLNDYHDLLGALLFIRKKAICERKDVLLYSKRANKLKESQKDYIFRRYFYIRDQVNSLLSDNNMVSQDGGGEGFGWIGIFQDVAERQVFGNMEALMNTRFIDVLTYLIRTKIINDKIIREQERQRARLEAQTM